MNILTDVQILEPAGALCMRASDQPDDVFMAVKLVLHKLTSVDTPAQGVAAARLMMAASELLEALEHIVEYWNRDQNEDAMADALWHIIEVAYRAVGKAKELQS